MPLIPVFLVFLYFYTTDAWMHFCSFDNVCIFWQRANSNLSEKKTLEGKRNVQITHKNIIIWLDKTLTAHFRGKGSEATAVASQPWRFWKCSCCTPRLRQLWKWRPQINKSSSETHDKLGNAYIFTLHLWIMILVLISCCGSHIMIILCPFLQAQCENVNPLTLYHCANMKRRKKSEEK